MSKNSKMQKPEAKKQAMPALPSKRELTNALVQVDNKVNQLHKQFESVIGSLTFVVDHLTKETETVSETQFSEEYLAKHIHHLFTNMYYDKATESFIRIDSIAKDYSVEKTEGSFTFTKGEKTYIIDAEDEFKARELLRKKLRASETFTPIYTLEEVKEVAEEAAK